MKVTSSMINTVVMVFTGGQVLIFMWVGSLTVSEMVGGCYNSPLKEKRIAGRLIITRELESELV